MSEPYFNQEWISVLAENRYAGIGEFFLAASFLGEIEGYVLIIAAVLVFWDKRVALQSTAVVLIAMTLNHLLKIVIQNPRPFVLDGTHLDMWAVPHANAIELAAEFSTPSGHAMAAAAFYGFLWSRSDVRWVRWLCLIAIGLTGLSRPVLGVHFVEDIVLGWSIGLLIAWFFYTNIDHIWRFIGRLSLQSRGLLALALSAAVWALTLLLLPRPISELPTAFINYAGFLSGVILVLPAFTNPMPSNVTFFKGILSWALFVGGVLAFILGADFAFSMIADDQSIMGYGLRFLRYLLVAVIGFTLARAYLNPQPAASC